MITQAGLLDWAEYVPGPADKVYSEPCTSEVYLPHDAVGYLHGWYSRLFDLERLPNGRYTANAAASVTGIILEEIDPRTGDAKCIQHYPFNKSCWASGSRSINIRGNAFENVRLKNDFNNLVLPPHMVRTNLRIIREMEAHFGWKARRPTSAADLTATCMEHRECIRFGAASTTCPNDRASQIWAALGQPAAGGRDVPVQHNRIAKWGTTPGGWRGKQISGVIVVQARKDLELPPCSAVDIDLRISPGPGAFVQVEGAPGQFVDVLDAKKTRDIITVPVAADGTIRFVCAGTSRIDEFGSVRVWG